MFKVKSGNNKMNMTKCPFCGKGPNDDGYFDFKDVLSAREYQISGLCQECQDDTFVEYEDGC